MRKLIWLNCWNSCAEIIQTIADLKFPGENSWSIQFLSRCTSLQIFYCKFFEITHNPYPTLWITVISYLTYKNNNILMQQFSSYILGLLLSLSLKKQKNPPPKKLLYFRKWNFLALRLKDFLYFLKKSFSYIAGNRTFCERTFTTRKKKKSPPRKSFLHFGI